LALYKAEKVNPLAGCLPIFIQLPIFIGLWRAIVASLASNPKDLLGLEHRILFRGFLEGVLGVSVDSLVPLQNRWLWLNLALPDPYYILPALVLVTSYVQQKLIMPPMPASKDIDPNDPSAQAAQMTRQMTTFMPFFFGFLALSYSSGLSIYFITSNILGIVQYVLMGKADLRRLIGRGQPEEAKADVAVTADEDAVETSDSGRKLKPGITETFLTAKPKPASVTAANPGRASRAAPVRNTSDSRGRRKSERRVEPGGQSGKRKASKKKR
jgi:YidC/Oxa1 family membrane protein insertase